MWQGLSPQTWWRGKKRMMIEMCSFSLDNSASVRFSERCLKKLCEWEALENYDCHWFLVSKCTWIGMHTCMFVCTRHVYTPPPQKKKQVRNWLIQNRAIICMLLIPSNLIDICILLAVFFPMTVNQILESILSFCLCHILELFVSFVGLTFRIHFSYFKKHL